MYIRHAQSTSALHEELVRHCYVIEHRLQLIPIMFSVRCTTKLLIELKVIAQLSTDIEIKNASVNTLKKETNCLMQRVLFNNFYLNKCNKFQKFFFRRFGYRCRFFGSLKSKLWSVFNINN